MTLGMFMVAAAVVCWTIAIFNEPTRHNLIAAGLALCGLAYIFQGVHF